MLRDLRYAIRALSRQRVFTLTATTVLGLAISVNTAVFSIINSLLFRPLPVRTPQNLGFVYDTDDRSEAITYGDFVALQSKSDIFSSIAAAAGDTTRLRTDGGVISVHGEDVTANYLDVLGVEPRIGRSFTASDDRDTAEPVAIISESLWRSRFAGDPGVLGRPIQLAILSPYAGRYAGWREFIVVGVMPASFTGMGNPWQPTDFWVPLRQRQADFRLFYGTSFTPAQADHFPVLPIVRLRDGVTFAQARA
ncbi:MAG: ABC transporter permease [Vicinamibacterales bacterium]